MDKREKRFWDCVAFGIGNACWLWTKTKNDNGYGVTNFKGHRTTSHRISYILTKGKPPEGMVVMHSCDNRLCCNPAHLSVGTQKENIQEMHKKGRAGDTRNFGHKNGTTKYTDAQCQEMRRLHKEEKMTQTAISKKFGLAQSHVSRIIRGENRKVI